MSFDIIDASSRMSADDDSMRAQSVADHLVSLNGFAALTWQLEQDRRRGPNWVTAYASMLEDDHYRVVHVSLNPDRCSANYITADARSSAEGFTNVERGAIPFENCDVPAFLADPRPFAAQTRDDPQLYVSHEPVRFLNWGDGELVCRAVIRGRAGLEWWSEFIRLRY